MRWPWLRRASGGESARWIGSSDPVLAFAQAYLAVVGARTRWNGEALSATLPDGNTQVYAANPGGTDAQVIALVPGSAMLSAMLDDVNAHSRIGALVLPRTHDPESLVRDALVSSPKTCGRCVTGIDPGNGGLCDQCPLRTGGSRFVVAALPRRSSLKTQREATATSVELTYRLSVRDRGGRAEEVVRLALDADGRLVEPLSPTQARTAGAGTVPQHAATLAKAAVARAEETLRPALDAAALVWRMRSADVYRKRLDDLTSTGDRLRREHPDDDQAVLQSLQRELASLAGTFAIEPRATLESTFFVDAPLALVAWHTADGRETAFRVDAGRGCVVAKCATCGTLTKRGSICGQGHVTCASCGSGCGACRGSNRAAGPSAPKKASRTHSEASALTLEQLDTMEQFTPRLWHTTVAWLLSHDGYALRDAGPDATTWHATHAGREVIIVARASGPGVALGSEDVRRVAVRARDMGAQGLLLSLARATSETAALAQDLGVVLWDRVRLGEILAVVASKQMRAAGPTRGEAKELVATAIKTRAALLEGLTNAAAALESKPPGERVVGSAALSAAISDLGALRQSSEQAFLAWETLVADWLAMFPERVTPTGGLVIEANREALRGLRERATHLGTALASVMERLGSAPRHGELGYDGWCAALIEECAARCASLQARVALVDPSQWEDARRARSSEAEVAAARADQERRYAAARAAKAYAQVAHLANRR